MLLLLTGVLLLAIACVAVLARQDSGAAPKPAPDPSTSTPDRPRTPLPVGLNTAGALLGLDHHALDRAMADIAATGMTWIRVDFSWTEIQPTSPDAYVWGPTDRVVAAARAHGIHVLGLITYTPGWARAAGCTSFICPPASPRTFGRFAQEVGDRYVPRGVRTFQVWNEPNLDIFWKNPDPSAYGALVRQAASALRTGRTDRADQVRVVLGSLAMPEHNAGGVDPAVFVRAACAHGCHVDAVGFDPYTFPELPSASSKPMTAWYGLTSGGQLRRAIDRSIGRDVPVWVTQFGAPVADGAVRPPFVDEQRQTAIIVAGLRLARRDPLVGGFFVNAWRDVAGSPDYRDRFGLWRADGTARPAVAALRHALHHR